MNHLTCPPHMLTSSAAHLVQEAPAMQVTSIMSSMQTPTSVVPAMAGVMSYAGMPMGTIALAGGATLQAVAVQAATMAIRQGTPFVNPTLTASGEQVNAAAIGQQVVTQATMVPASQNCPMPINFHIPQQSKHNDGMPAGMNLITTMAQNLTNDAQQNLVNTTLAQQHQLQLQHHQQQQAQQQQQQQQQPPPQQPQPGQQQAQQPQAQQAQPHQQHTIKIDNSTVSTLGLGLTQDMAALHASQINPHFLAAVAPGLGIQAPAPISVTLPVTSTSTLTVADSSAPPPKKKKKKSKKKKVPTSLTPSSSSIPDKLVTYKPNCGESDMEAFMAYQRLCNTHLDLKAKLHLLYNSRHSCQLCHREFKGFCRLRRHLQSHADFRPYKCESCSKRFYNVSKLKRHSLVHSGLKPYKCPLCDSSLSRREHLKRHMLTHSEERPYRCSGCDYSSRRLDGVHKHIKGKHSGEDCKVMYVRPQIFDLLAHDFVTQTVKGGPGDSKESPGSPIKDPLTDKDAFLQLMMGNIKFSQLLTTGTTSASNAPKPPTTTDGVTKKKKKKKRKASNPMQIKETKAEEEKVDPPKFPEGVQMTLPLVTAPLVSVGNGLLDQQRAIFQQNNRSQSQTPVGDQNVMTEPMPHPHTPTPQNLVQNQQGEIVLNVTSQNSHQLPQMTMTIANNGNIKQESGTPQPQGENNGTNTPHPVPQPSPMPQQFQNFSSTAHLLPQGQQFFPAHISGDQVQVSMQNTTIPVPNTGSAFQSVYAGGTYEPVPPQMVPGKYFPPVPPNTMYESDPFNGVPPGVAGIAPFFRRRIGQGCRQLNDMPTFHLQKKQTNFGGTSGTHQ